MINMVVSTKDSVFQKIHHPFELLQPVFLHEVEGSSHCDWSLLFSENTQCCVYSNGAIMMTLVRSGTIYFVIPAVPRDSKKNMNLVIFKWFWNFATDPRWCFVSLFQKENYKPHVSLSTQRTSSILGKPFSQAEEVLLGWQVLIFTCLSQESQDMEFENFNYAILRRLTKIYVERMVKCPTETLSKQ